MTKHASLVVLSVLFALFSFTPAFSHDVEISGPVILWQGSAGLESPPWYGPPPDLSVFASSIARELGADGYRVQVDVGTSISFSKGGSEGYCSLSGDAGEIAIEIGITKIAPFSRGAIKRWGDAVIPIITKGIKDVPY